MRNVVMYLIASVALVSPVAVQVQEVPAVRPFFSTVDDGPAFFVECRNSSTAAVSTGETYWLSSLRLDGKVLTDEGGRIGPGLTSLVQPGELWRGIVVLRQAGTGYFPAVKFGALTRTSRVTTVTPGRHTFTVRCGDVWSDDLVFFWESER